MERIAGRARHADPSKVVLSAMARATTPFLDTVRESNLVAAAGVGAALGEVLVVVLALEACGRYTRGVNV